MSSLRPEYHVYKLETGGHGVEEMKNGEEDVAAASNWVLPNEDFFDLWDSLIYENDIKNNVSFLFVLFVYKVKIVLN